MRTPDIYLLGGVVVLTCIAAFLYWQVEGRRRRKSQRLASLITLLNTAEANRTQPMTIRRSVREGYGFKEILDRLVGRYAPLTAPLPVSTSKAIALGITAGAGVFAIGDTLLNLNLPVSLLVGGASFALAPRAVCSIALERQRHQLLNQLPDALAFLVRAARTGMPISDGIRACSQEMPSPTADEFRAIADALTVGIPLEVALEEAAGRTGMPEYRFFVAAVSLQEATGGSIAETLDNLAEVIRGRKALALKAQALTAQTKTAAYVLSALPIFVVASLSMVSPGYLTKLLSPDGRIFLGLSVVMLTLGLGSMQAIIRSMSR